MDLIIVRRTVALFGFAGFSLSLVLHGTTFFGLDLLQMFPWMQGLYICVFPPFLLFVALERARQADRKRSWATFSASMSSSTQLMLFVFLGYALVNFLLFLHLSEGGIPYVQSDNYILQNKGAFIRELTEKEYQWHNTYRVRGISGHLMLFYLAPALYFWERTTVIQSG